MTGTLKGTVQGALWVAVTAGVSYEVAEGVSALTGVNAHSATLYSQTAAKRTAGLIKAIAHGLSRAALSKLRYGTTKGAFMSGFISLGFSVGAKAEYGAIKMAIIGGTVSELGGGKFANGAMGSAFEYLFNDALYGFKTGSLLDIAGKIWALPNTIVGLIYGGVGYISGLIMGTNPSITFGHNAIEFVDNPFVMKNAAITLGNTISYKVTSITQTQPNHHLRLLLLYASLSKDDK